MIIIKKLVFAILLTLPLSFILSCGEKTQLITHRESGALVQEFNPSYLEVLWVVDDRSSLFSSRPVIRQQAENFFRRLDAATQSGDYRMGFITADMHIAKGQLKPIGSPIVLTKNLGTLEQRAALFSTVLTQVPINLNTGAESMGLQSTYTALKNYFKPASDIPLVIVYISDSDDRSNVPNGESNVIEYYAKTLRSFKSKPELLRVYSINYVPIEASDTVEQKEAKRCATENNADIDVMPGFEDRYNKVALKLGGSTANLCSSNWSNEVNLNGLTLKEPSKRFKLDKPARPETIIIEVIKGSEKVQGLTWHYDASTNEIVFDTAPPAGSKIILTYSI